MPDREESFRGALEFYNNDELAARVWTDKYALRNREGGLDETSPTQTWGRLLQYFPDDPRVHESIRNGWVVPAGRILFAMGNPNVKATQLNCYVIPIEDDSLEGIFDCAKAMARTYSYGGGCGIDIGCLRPNGSGVNNTALTSSGSVSFMDFFSTVTGTVGQHGRRGALMITIPVHHPDALEFIKIKDDLDPKAMLKASSEMRNYLYNRRTVGHANITVKLTDEFMRAVEKGEQFRLHWESSDGSVVHEKFVDAREYWKDIYHQAWKQAEPGLMFWDRMVEESPSDQYEGGEVLTTNPCFTGEMRLHTADGMMTFANLQRLGIDNTVVTDARISADSMDSNHCGVVARQATLVKLTAKQQQIFKLTTKHGHQISCTAYHKFPTPEGRKELNELKIGDTLLLQSGEGKWGTIGNYDDGIILGSMTGDGNMSPKYKGGPPCIMLAFWDEPDMASKLERIVKKRIASASSRSFETAAGIVNVSDSNILKQRISSGVLYRYMHDQYGIDKDDKKRVPECIWQGSRGFVQGYLAGLFQADGSVQLSSRKVRSKQTLSVRLSQSNIGLLRDVQVLLGNFGIVSSVYPRREAQERNLPDGKGGYKAYCCKSQYELIINRPNSIVFKEKVGFAGNKQEQLVDALAIRGLDCRKPERFITAVKSVEPDGVEDVYCLTEPETNSIVVNGVVTAQCGEQPLPPYDSCNLGSVNLRHMIDNPWVEKAEVDWNKFEKAIRSGVTFLDTVRTVEAEDDRFPLPKQREASEKFRRIGLGIMGFGEMVASLGMIYGSKECIQFTEKLFKFMRDVAYDQSVELAKKLGSFPAFDWNKHKRCPFIKRLPDELQDKIAEHGLRNVTVLSIAPTGSIAIIGQTSGGIEPMFAPLYKRYSNLGGKDRMEFRVFDPAIVRWQEAIGADFPIDADSVTPETLDMLPPFFVFSHDVSWQARVDLQGVAQKFVDSSISSTINLPADVTDGEVATIYTRGWKAGCKGVTVYRENCRENILETIDPEADIPDEKPAAKKKPWIRPTVLHANSISFMSHEKRVFLDFCHNGDTTLKEVKIVMGRSGDEVHALCEALGRCVSKLLQNDVPVDDIAESLRGIKAGDTQWLRFDENQKTPYVVRSVPDAIAAYMHYAYVEPARKAAKAEATMQVEPDNSDDMVVMDESLRGGSCPQCEGVDEYGRK